ncbi:hypothetical protein QBZ16_003952 [Prototheca wickerhamii]|uniref:Protein kinase domain-containing protein n=1 Tax=Prototheca wickerhamii TaxID=3111 RepID=A0AAD9IJ42_PROWI|nr:hypothetical protein QBZ16_003952 [Prototheca wickerhamii]
MPAEALRPLLPALLLCWVLLLTGAHAQASCPVVLNYDVNLGQGNTSQVPIFVATITLQNEDDQVTVEQWLLEWDFPYDSVIASPSDLFDKSVELLTPGSPSVALFGDYDRSIAPNGVLQFGFLGSKSNGQTSESNPFNVGPLENVSFNNLECHLITSSPDSGSPPAAAQNGTILQVEYTPIAYINQPLENTFTQFLVRLRNIQNATVIPLEEVSLQYWFHGPEGNLPIVAEYDPGQVFSVRCEWATIGCQYVNLSVIPGDMNVPSARFAVNVSLLEGAGSLLPSGENAVPSLFLGQGVDVMDLLVTLTTYQGVAILNSTDDFSYLDTPELPVTGNATISSNEHMPAFINGTQVWGTMPPSSEAQAGGDGSALSSAGLAIAPGAERSGAASGLPLGVTCASMQNQTYQSCNLAVRYCCASASGQALAPFPPQLLEGVDGPEGEPAAETIVLPSPRPAPAPAPPDAQTGSGTPTAPSGGSSGTSAGVIAVAVAVPTAVVALAALAFAVWRSKRRARERRERAQWISSSDVEKGASDKDGGSDPEGPAPPAARGTPRRGGLPPQTPLAATPRVAPVALAAQQRPLQSTGSGVSGNSTQPLLANRSGTFNASPFAPGAQRFNSGYASAADQPVAEYGDSFWADLGAAEDAGATRQSSHGWQPLLPRLDSVALGFAATPRADGASTGPFGSAEDADSAPPAEDEAEEPRPDITALLERKAPTVQLGSLAELAALARAVDARGDATPASVAGGVPRPSQSTDGGAASGALSRSKSWSGELEDLDRLEDGLPAVLRLHQGRGALGHGGGSGGLAKASPRSAEQSGSSGAGPELHVDYPTEVAPYLGRCLGTGGFGVVHEATWRGRRVAVKTLPPMGPDASVGTAFHDALQREVALASRFDCDRLVRVLGASTSRPESMCLIMELMEGGNLGQRIYDRHKRRLGYLEILQLAHDVAAGLAYLHPSVVHRDLKPQNILLDREGRAKIADFGISKVKDPTKSYLSQVTNENGTPIYMAPEQLNSTNINEKVDVYALGVILNECYTRRQPWRDTTNLFQIILRVAINKERPPIDPGCPEPLRWLITKCWQQEPTLRPSCAELVRITELMIRAEVAKWEELHAGIARRERPHLNPFI